VEGDSGDTTAGGEVVGADEMAEVPAIEKAPPEMSFEQQIREVATRFGSAIGFDNDPFVEIESVPSVDWSAFDKENAGDEYDLIKASAKISAAIARFRATAEYRNRLPRSRVTIAANSPPKSASRCGAEAKPKKEGSVKKKGSNKGLGKGKKVARGDDLYAWAVGEGIRQRSKRFVRGSKPEKTRAVRSTKRARGG